MRCSGRGCPGGLVDAATTFYGDVSSWSYVSAAMTHEGKGQLVSYVLNSIVVLVTDDELPGAGSFLYVSSPNLL